MRASVPNEPPAASDPLPSLHHSDPAAGGSPIYAVPSLDLAIHKISSSDPALTGLPVTYQVDHLRDNWKLGPHDRFHDRPVGADDGAGHLL
jgi:hypothetical protein